MNKPQDAHSRLIALQSDAELDRKWQKAKGRHSRAYWAQEQLDVIAREAKRMSEYFQSLGL